MRIALPELHGPATIALDQDDRLNDDAYFAFCEANPDLRAERTAEGEIVIMPPAGLESDHRSVDAAAQLYTWAKKTRRGIASGSSAEFFLPDGSALSPDAAWTSHERLASVPAEARKRFPRTTPEFVIEVMSPSDRLRAAQRKMQQWIDNGVELGWLIDGDRETVYVYRGNREAEKLTGISQIEGEGPVAGFTLDLADIWAGL